jgi:prohibitin 1
MKKKFIPQITLFAFLVFTIESCVIVGPNQVGIKQKLGRLDGNVYQPGPVSYNPFITKVIVIDINTKNMEVSIGLPSKEGLTINAVVSVLYHIDATKVKELLTNTGLNYEQSVIFPVFRSAAADVSARFYAKDLHSGERQEIEKEIKEKMALELQSRGIVVEAILMKSITLPEGLSRSIEEKLKRSKRCRECSLSLNKRNLKPNEKLLRPKVRVMLSLLLLKV